ncbi:polysaccharide lyase 8 family protein [Paenibacillus pectinilyticus]|nr:polysaccharide lyase 8 family protein [Paenibacillus pectinilyticus]
MAVRCKQGFLWSLILVLFASIVLSISSQRAYAADEYDGLRTKWKGLLAGDSYNTSDPDIADQITAITATANGYWTTLNTSASRTALWTDLTDWTVSSTLTSTYNRLKSMALAYATVGSSLYGNVTLASDINGGLDWMYTNKYNESKNQSDNWWDWQIGTPQLLMDTAILMYDTLSATQLTNYYKPIDKWVADPTKRYNSTTVETGANRSDKAQVVIVRGILGKSTTKIAQGRDALSQIFPYVSSGDGFYTDGSFIQHTNIAYTGSYGNVLIAGLSKLLYVLKGSTWEVTDANVSYVYNWITEAYQPLIYKGAVMDMVRGRAISREDQQDHMIGKSVMASIARLGLSATTTKSNLFKSLIKAWVQQDTSFPNYYANVAIFDITLLKSILSDTAVTPAAELTSNTQYAEMARVVHLRPGFGYGISMSSSRIARYESINSENLHGWHTGDGMTYLYNGDINQFGQGYWPTVNPYRLPGITVDPVTLTNAQGNVSVSTYNFVGGVTDGNYGVAGMRFSSIGSDLTGRKSWFMFGNKIAALGSSITSTSGRTIETIVDNRKLNTSGTNTLTVNGTAKSTNAGWSETMTGVNWAHLDGNVIGSGIGYYFPGSATVYGLREARTGAWSDINTRYSSTPITNSYASLAIQHGVSPTNASYAYVVLPNVTAAQTQTYASNADITVLENSADAQAVKDSSLNAVGINFWNNITKIITVDGANYLTSNKQASVFTKESTSDLEVVVADPTQTNTGTIALEINRTATGINSSDATITVTQLSPTIKLTVNVSGANGKSFKISLQKK